MKVCLSLVLDLLGRVKLDLCECDNLREMDKFITTFNDHQEIRTSKVFAPIIERFLEEKKYFTKNFKREADKKGRIMITYLSDDLNCRAIPILYSKDERFLNQKYCYSLFKNYLFANPRILKEMSSRDRKYYLFSRYEIDEINYICKINNSKKYEELVKMIIRQFQNRKDPYFYVRSFLSYYRNFDKVKNLPSEINTEHGVISKIDQELIALSDRIDKLEASESISRDEYFNQVVEQENSDELYNLYSLDEISANSSNPDLPLGQVYRKSQEKK